MENKQKKKYRVSDIISIAGLLVIIYGFAAATLIVPDTEFSEDENRMLQQKPKLTVETLVNGTFTSEIAKYFADQFPMRNVFVGAKAVAEISLQKQENDDVLLGKDGHIIAKDDYPDYAEVDKNIKALKRFDEALGETDFRVAVAGRAQDALTAYMPALYPGEEVTDTIFSYFSENLGAIPQIELLQPLRAKADAGEYVYYRTDHHWTTLGAYYAYVEIMNSYGMEPYPIEHFTRETVSDAFYGTTWSKAGMKWIGPDSMEFFRWDGDDTMVTEIVDSGEKMEGMYDLSYLEVKDKYSTFIGGNNGRVRIYPADGSPLAKEKRETMLLIKDSFGHSLAPFLAAHFDLEIIDLRYYKLSLMDLIGESGASKVLAMYNMDSVTNSNSLQMLNFSLK